MKIYLDTKDLINVFERGFPCESDQFEYLLRENGHELILSYLNVMEISAPLIQKDSTTNVMRLLNRIERLPIKYIAKIFQFELREGYCAFKEKREYSHVNPYFGRFDETVEEHGTPPTQIFLNFPLSETVFTLWSEDPKLFRGYSRYLKPLKEVFHEDRNSSGWKNYRANFTRTVGRQLELEQIYINEHDIEPYAKWIYQNSSRCPSVRLRYELFHKMVSNLQDIPKEGDIPDYGHVNCLPYVDIFSADRRMCSYAIQASKVMGLDYEKRVFNTIEDVFSILKRNETGQTIAHEIRNTN